MQRISTIEFPLGEGSKSSTVHEAHASEAGPSGGGGSGPSGSSSRQLLLGPSRRSDTDVVGTSHSSLKPSHYEVLEGHSELHTEEAVSATNHYPLAQLDDAAEEIADVHSVNPLDPGGNSHILFSKNMNALTVPVLLFCKSKCTCVCTRMP